MSLSLPYFKMDVIDWLKSEKIEAMNSTAVGGYIMLLCEAWTRPYCSLPSARLALTKLARWTGNEEEFTQVLHCFTPCKEDNTRLINVRLRKVWDETNARLTTLSEAGKRGAQIKQSKRKTSPRSRPRNVVVRVASDAEFAQFWDAYPKKEDKKDARVALGTALKKTTLDVLLHAITRLSTTEGWTNNGGQYIPIPTTWLNKERWSDQPLSNGSQSLTCPHHPTLTFPDAQAKRTHDFSYHPKYVG